MGPGLQSLCLLGTMAAGSAQVSFIGIGDWGGSGLGGHHVQNQKDVASQMATTAQSAGIQFVMNTGDNFYYCGIQNTSDYQINLDFESVYDAESLSVPWYSVLGNHEYGYNPDAQIEYKDPKGRWVMDAHYYSKRVQLGSSGVYASMFFLDTSPCVTDYRKDDPSGWDPCSTQYPTCSPVDEGTCEFHSNIMKQDCQAQHTWFTNALAKVPSGDWIIVNGHHQANEIDVADFVTPMEQAGVDLYINGHVHTLNQYSINGRSSYVTTGAGAMVNTKDQEQHEQHMLKAAPSYELVWDKKIAGFTLHTFSSDLSELTTEYLDYQGNSLRSFTVKKGVAPGPSPSPPSGSSCKVRGCIYKSGESCQCDEKCSTYHNCCSDYDSVCKSQPVVNI